MKSLFSQARHMLNLRMINGDDRFRATLIPPSEIEKYDGELGLIAQKSKQEESTPTEKFNTNMAVTYLKTALVSPDGSSLLRSDSIAKLILGRYNRERVRLDPAPYSLVIETLMAGTRAVESPYLWWLVSWLYNVSDIAKAWFERKLSTDEVVAGSVIEQMLELKRTKGKMWLKKKNIDADYVINKLAEKYGLSPDGHRASSEYFTLSDSGRQVLSLERIPIVSKLIDVYSTMSSSQLAYFADVVKR